MANVTMRSPAFIAGQIFKPSGVAARTAWNKTQQVAAVARRLCPVDTGALRRSIKARKARDVAPTEIAYEVSAGGDQLKYAAAQEFGFVHYRSRRFIPGKHYLRDALRTVRW